MATALASAYAARRSSGANDRASQRQAQEAEDAREQARAEARDARLWDRQEADMQRLILERDYWRNLALELARLGERAADSPPAPPAPPP